MSKMRVPDHTPIQVLLRPLTPSLFLRLSKHAEGPTKCQFFTGGCKQRAKQLLGCFWMCRLDKKQCSEISPSPSGNCWACLHQFHRVNGQDSSAVWPPPSFTPLSGRPRVATDVIINPCGCWAARRLGTRWVENNLVLYKKRKKKQQLGEREAIHGTEPAVTYLHVPSQRHPNIKAETEQRQQRGPQPPPLFMQANIKAPGSLWKHAAPLHLGPSYVLSAP